MMKITHKMIVAGKLRGILELILSRPEEQV